MLAFLFNWPWGRRISPTSRSTITTRDSEHVLNNRYGQFYEPSRDDPMKTWRLGEQMTINVMPFFPTYTVSLWEDLGNAQECGAVLRQAVDHRPGPLEYNWTVQTYFRPLPRPAAHNYYYLLVTNGSDYDPNERAAKTNVTGPKFTSAMFNIVAANFTESTNGTAAGNGATSSAGSGTLNPTAPGAMDTKGAEEKTTALPIALGVVVGVLGLALLSLISYWWFVQRRRPSSNQPDETPVAALHDRSQLDGREMSPTEAKTYRESSTAHMSPVTQHSMSESPWTEPSEFGNHRRQGAAELGP